MNWPNSSAVSNCAKLKPATTEIRTGFTGWGVLVPQPGFSSLYASVVDGRNKPAQAGVSGEKNGLPKRKPAIHISFGASHGLAGIRIPPRAFPVRFHRVPAVSTPWLRGIVPLVCATTASCRRNAPRNPARAGNQRDLADLHLKRCQQLLGQPSRPQQPAALGAIFNFDAGFAVHQGFFVQLCRLGNGVP